MKYHGGTSTNIIISIIIKIGLSYDLTLIPHAASKSASKLIEIALIKVMDKQLKQLKVISKQLK